MFSVCVYCGAADVAPAYFELAREVGQAIASQGWQLVYGGGNTGLMGAVANGALEAEGEVVGIMPTFLVDQERAHDGLKRMEVVPDMATRKARFFRLSDIFITLPGGMGTLDELYESITAYQLGLHQGLSYILNANGFYNGLKQQMEHQHEEGFIHKADTEVPWQFVETLPALIQHIKDRHEAAR